MISPCGFKLSVVEEAVGIKMDWQLLVASALGSVWHGVRKKTTKKKNLAFHGCFIIIII